MSTKQGDIFVAVVYHPPINPEKKNNEESYSDLLEVLSKNITSFQRLGTVVVMGDFNSRDPTIIGDHAANRRKEPTRKFMKTIDWVNMINATQFVNGLHYTCIPERNGKSIPDMVLHSRHTCENFTNYEVHRDKHAGSDHRLITFELKGTAEFPKKLWEDSTGVPKKWTDENIKVYQQNISNQLPLSPMPASPDKEWVVRRESTLTDVLTQAS